MVTALAPVIVRLTPAEFPYTRYIADERMRSVRAYARKNVAKLAGDDDEDRNHLNGVSGEHAFAKWLGIERPPHKQYGRCEVCRCYVGTVGTFKNGGDVDGYQVRAPHYSRGRLIVRDIDRDTDIFVLVVPHVVLTFRIVGWILGADAKQYQWRNDPRARGAAYFVPQEALWPMLTLPREDV